MVRLPRPLAGALTGVAVAAARAGSAGGGLGCRGRRGVAASRAGRRAAARDLDLPALAGLAWWLAVWRMLDWHLGMAEGGDGRPRARLSTADAVTLARFWLVPALPAAARAGAPLPRADRARGRSRTGSTARSLGVTAVPGSGRDLDTTADLAFLTTAAVSAPPRGPALSVSGSRRSPLATGSGSPSSSARCSVARGAPRSAPGRGARRFASAGSCSAPPTGRGSARRSWSPAASFRHARRRRPCRRRDAGSPS